MTFEKICLIIGLVSNGLHLLAFTFLIIKSLRGNKSSASEIIKTGVSVGKSILSACGITSVASAVQSVETIKEIFNKDNENKEKTAH